MINILKKDKKFSMWLIVLMLLFLGTAWALPATSAENRLIPFQGRLTNSQGEPLHGVYLITFSIYDEPTGGGSVWTEEHKSVSIINGQLNVLLGNMTLLDDPDGNGDPQDAVMFDASSGLRFLGIKVGEDSNQEMVPRHQLVPAFHARTADQANEANHALEADNADTLDGHDSSYFLHHSEINGNVGIGTTSPDALLHLNRDGSAGPCLLLTNPNLNSKNSVMYFGSGQPGIGKHFFLANDWQGVNVDILSIGYNNAGSWTEHMTITPNGNVGINTKSPAQKLHVMGHIQVDGAITAPEGTLRDDNGGWIRTYGNTGWYNQTYAGGWHMIDSTWIRSYGGKSIYHDAGIMRTDGTFEVGPGGNRFRVDGYGNVGIGTVTPIYKLQIHASVNQLGLVRPSSETTGGKKVFLELYQQDSPTPKIPAVYPSIRFHHASRFYNRIEGREDGFHFKTGDITKDDYCRIYGIGKFFNIPDPRYNDAKKRLIHATLEGPEIGVYYRGEAKLVNRVVTIELPDYFEALTREEGRTVLLTAKNDWSPLFVDGEVKDGKFVVKTTAQGDPEQEFFWEVKAVRADIEPLQVEAIREE